MRSEAVDLIRTVLAEHCADDDAALAFLETALAREVDPLRACAAQFGLGEAVALARAARWAGLAFRASVPVGQLSPDHPLRLEGLGELRGIALRVQGGHVTFCAVDFFTLLRLKLARQRCPELRRRLCLVTDAVLRRELARLAGAQLVQAARLTITRRWPYATAQLDLGRGIRLSFVALVGLLLVLMLLAPHVGQFWLLPLTLLVIGAPAALRLAALFAHPSATGPVDTRPDDADLPVYSVLLPLRDEAHMVPQLARAMRRLNYPPEKLDVIFVVEERSPQTIVAVEQHAAEPPFVLVTVPDALPRTKPKALDLALPLCRGEFVVVYDAEDTPHPDQLWQAVSRFRQQPELACLQARLVIDNGRRHPLAALFAGEYAGLFSVLLPALARWQLPLPLGGTSNHFRLATLRDIGGWDPFNVTEDADLGMRLARRRLRVDMFDSPTFEDAPTQLGIWTAQRSRWFKGWMQTFIVHNRRPLQLWRDLGTWPLLGFEILVIGMILAPLLHTGFLLMVLVRCALHLPVIDGLWSWSGFYLALFLLGYGAAIATAIQGLLRYRMRSLLLPQLLLPFYWTLMVPASLRALRELAIVPFYWAKTPHAAASAHRLDGPEPAVVAANENAVQVADKPIAAQ